MKSCSQFLQIYWLQKHCLPEFAKLYCQNIKGEPITYEGDELTGRVLQHEFDHLKGKLLLSSLTRKERKEAIKKITVNGFPGDDI